MSAEIQKLRPDPSPTDISVNAAIDAFIERHAIERMASSWPQVERYMKQHISPAFGHVAVSQVKRRDISGYLNSLAKTAPGSATYLHAVLRKFFRWCVQENLIEVSPIADLPPPVKAKKPVQILSELELALIWVASNELEPHYGALFKLLILTGRKRSEIATMRWPDVNLDQKVWHIAGQTLAIPLCPKAIAILAQYKRSDGFVLSSDPYRPLTGFSSAKNRIDAAIRKTIKLHRLTSVHGPQIDQMSPWRIETIRKSVKQHVKQFETVEFASRADYRNVYELWAERIVTVAATISTGQSHDQS